MQGIKMRKGEFEIWHPDSIVFYGGVQVAGVVLCRNFLGIGMDIGQEGNLGAMGPVWKDRGKGERMTFMQLWNHECGLLMSAVCDS